MCGAGAEWGGCGAAVRVVLKLALRAGAAPEPAADLQLANLLVHGQVWDGTRLGQRLPVLWARVCRASAGEQHMNTLTSAIDRGQAGLAEGVLGA